MNRESESTGKNPIIIGILSALNSQPGSLHYNVLTNEPYQSRSVGL